MRDNTALLTIFNESEYRGQSTECRAVDIYKIYRVPVYTYTSNRRVRTSQEHDGWGHPRIESASPSEAGKIPEQDRQPQLIRTRSG